LGEEGELSPGKETPDMTSSFRWRGSLYQYHDRDLCSVVFKSEKNLRSALARLFDPDHALFGAPFEIVDERTLILPKEALPDLSDLSPEEGEPL
jgi:hypothetical protein